MDSSENSYLKSKLKKAKELLAQETESLKKKTLALRRNFDQLKSKNALKSLALKKRLQESNLILSDSRIVWKSELLNLKNSSEIFQATQSRKQLIREKIFEELIKTVSSINLSHLALTDKENISTQVFTEGVLDTSCNCSESTLNQTMARTMDSIKEKVKNLCGSSFANNLTAVDEKIEISIETNPNFNIEGIGDSDISDSFYSHNEEESSYNAISSNSGLMKSFESSSQKESFNSPEHISERSSSSYVESSMRQRHESFSGCKGNFSSLEEESEHSSHKDYCSDKIGSKTSRHESFNSCIGNKSSSKASGSISNNSNQYKLNSNSPDPALNSDKNTEKNSSRSPYSNKTSKSNISGTKSPKPVPYKSHKIEKTSSKPSNSNRSHKSNISSLKSPRLASYKSYKSEINSSKHQPEEEEIDDTMIGLIEHTELQITTLGVITLPDHVKNEKEKVYVMCESENGEKTQEVQVSKKSWKMWICPCIFKVKY